MPHLLRSKIAFRARAEFGSHRFALRLLFVVRAAARRALHLHLAAYPAAPGTVASKVLALTRGAARAKLSPRTVLVLRGEDVDAVDAVTRVVQY